MKIGLVFFVPIIILTLVCAAFPFIIHDFLLLYGSSRSVGSIQNSQTLKKKQNFVQYLWSNSNQFQCVLLSWSVYLAICWTKGGNLFWLLIVDMRPDTRPFLCKSIFIGAQMAFTIENIGAWKRCLKYLLYNLHNSHLAFCWHCLALCSFADYSPNDSLFIRRTIQWRAFEFRFDKSKRTSVNYFVVCIYS